MNTYTPTWFELFMGGIEPAQTEREADFLARQLPQPAFTHVLDLCCGTGRHAHALARRGYRVLGVDRDPAAVAAARAGATPGAKFVVGDLREVDTLPGGFGAALILWQSFGYFGDETNADVLRAVHGRLRPGGRLVLDVYHRAFFEAHGGEQTFHRGGLTVTERKRMEGRRLRVELDYGGERPGDAFDWRLYTPAELQALGASVGWTPLLACAGFDEGTAASGAAPRMQLVFERDGKDGIAPTTKGASPPSARPAPPAEHPRGVRGHFRPGDATTPRRTDMTQRNEDAELSDDASSQPAAEEQGAPPPQGPGEPAGEGQHGRPSDDSDPGHS